MWLAPIAQCPFSDESSCLLEHLVVDGAVLLTNVPGMVSARQSALHGLHACITQNKTEGRLKKVMLADGTLRLTAAAMNLHGIRGQVPGCAELEASSASLRELVDITTMSVLHSLEPLVAKPGEVLPSVNGGWYKSLEDTVHNGQQLEHFHAYLPAQRESGASNQDVQSEMSSQAAVPMHTDSGLFIAMVPAMLVSTDPSLSSPTELLSKESGLRVQLANGSISL